MTASEELARRYRRWLRWYPASFRDEYEAEILGVLLAGAREGQRRPGAAECLDLLANGLRLRLRPDLSRTVVLRPSLNVLLYLGALLELAAAATMLATSDAVRAAVLDRYPDISDARLQAVLTGPLALHVQAACLVAAGWLGLGWAMGRGYRWARVALATLAGMNGSSLIIGLAGGSASVAQTDVVAGAALCLVQLLAVVIVFDRELARLVAWLPKTARAARPTRS